jgi:hypothetical protein
MGEVCEKSVRCWAFTPPPSRVPSTLTDTTIADKPDQHRPAAELNNLIPISGWRPRIYELLDAQTLITIRRNADFHPLQPLSVPVPIDTAVVILVYSSTTTAQSPGVLPLRHVETSRAL